MAVQQRGFDGLQDLARTSSPTSYALNIIAFVVVVAALWSAQVVIIPIVFAALASCGLEPVHRRLVRWHVPPAMSSAAILTVLVAVFAGAGWTLSSQATTFVNRLPTLTQRLREAIHDGHGALGGTMQPMQQAANDLKKAADESAPAPAKGVTRVQVEQPPMRIADVLWKGTMGAVGMLAQATMVLLLLYYMLASGARYKQKLLKLAGPSIANRHLTLDILNNITKQVEKFLGARVIISALVAVATGALLWALGVSQPVIWGLVAGVLNNIPYVGPTVAVIGISLATLVQFGSMQTAVIAGGASTLIALIEGFVLTPWMMGRAGRMNTGAVFVSLMFWGWIWGVWGMLFAVPIMMGFKAIGDHIDGLGFVSEVLGE